MFQREDSEFDLLIRTFSRVESLKSISSLSSGLFRPCSVNSAGVGLKAVKVVTSTVFNLCRNSLIVGKSASNEVEEEMLSSSPVQYSCP